MLIVFCITGFYNRLQVRDTGYLNNGISYPVTNLPAKRLPVYCLKAFNHDFLENPKIQQVFAKFLQQPFKLKV